MSIWNPWHGCKKISPGCLNCYVYRRDAEFGKDSSIVSKTSSFNLPLKKSRSGEYKLCSKDGPVFTCMTSDFFIEEADEWRKEVWQMIRTRKDLSFVIITKRILRFKECIPEDWGMGYENVTIMCTCENQEQADIRLPVFSDLPIINRVIIHEPMLCEIDIEKYLLDGRISQVVCGGESGENARICKYDWILDTRSQCIRNRVSFCFRQTGAFFQKGEKTYHIDRKYQLSQAKNADIDINFQGFKEIKSEDKYQYNDILERLSKSEFRSSFKLQRKEIEYIGDKGLEKIKSHAEDFIRDRLAPGEPEKDGKQTPMKGHPVFIAQHATATCCRECLYKWHHISKGRNLTLEEQKFAVGLIMEWIEKQC